MHDDATRNLLKLTSVIDPTKFSKPSSLNIITGTGMNYTRPDEINVISVASLGKYYNWATTRHDCRAFNLSNLLSDDLVVFLAPLLSVQSNKTASFT